MTATIQEQILSCLQDGPKSCSVIARMIRKDYSETSGRLRRMQFMGAVKKVKYDHGDVEWAIGDEDGEVDKHPAKHIRKQGSWKDVPMRLNWWDGTSDVRIWDARRKETNT